MGTEQQAQVGQIVWRDLTVKDAKQVQDFYSKVVGWRSEPLSMGDYDDFIMNAPGDGETVAGICHARGGNANVPPQWLMYIQVENVDASAKRCAELGGKVIDGPRAMGEHQFCVIQDPAGAVAALIGG